MRKFDESLVRFLGVVGYHVGLIETMTVQSNRHPKVASSSLAGSKTCFFFCFFLLLSPIRISAFGVAF